MARKILVVDDEKLVKAIEILTWAARTVAEGQALDMQLSKVESASVDDYIKMVYKKTAALFEASSAIGSVLAGASDDEVNLIRSYASNIGIAFQIRDDELGLIADEKKLGKPKYSDLREGKRTILVIYALDNASSNQREKILKTLGNRNASLEELEDVAKTIIELGALEFSDKLAQQYLSKGLESLNKIRARDEEAKKLLTKLAYFFARRQY